MSEQFFRHREHSEMLAINLQETASLTSKGCRCGHCKRFNVTSQLESPQCDNPDCGQIWKNIIIMKEYSGTIPPVLADLHSYSEALGSPKTKEIEWINDQFIITAHVNDQYL